MKFIKRTGSDKHGRIVGMFECQICGKEVERRFQSGIKLKSCGCLNKRHIMYKNKYYTYRELAEHTKINIGTLKSKIRSGKPMDQIINENKKRLFYKEFRSINDNEWNLSKITEYNTWI